MLALSVKINQSICLKKNQFFSSVIRQYLNVVINFSTKPSDTMKVLNVAEKNDAAKNIAAHLSRGTSRRREGLSKFNKIYEFNACVWNQNCQMIMTSVSGHLLTYEFGGNYRKWYGCPPLSLFDAPVMKMCKEESYEKIKKTLEKEIKSCQALIVWTDCDREGENIGFEIIQVCQAVKPNIRVYRAKFSEITQISIERALQNLEEPNKNLSDAVDVRSELDLRIGAAFTRFQTLRLQKTFPRNLSDMLISYGPCQFPTLGFVVERFLAIQRFEPEPYWKIKVTHTQNDLEVEFRWARNRLFEKLPCEVFLDICQENPQATVEKVTSKPKSKWRPLPLDTIELEKQGSRKLKLTAKATMQIAERLYTQGFISYPRTETNIFPKEMNLVSLVTLQTPESVAWGGFAQRLLQEGITPRQGKKSDQAHPPIHPTKYTDSLQGDEARVYEFVVRHFLACLSKNAEGYETIVEIDIAGEKFLTNGLQIIAKNYLEVYIYEKWSSKEIHIYERGQTFMPTSIDMLEETTSPPQLLTEADLIALMDKHGIGTDATHAEHIETIKSRHYVGLKDTKYLIPGKLGIGLVMGYDRMGFQMSKPHLRAELENDLKLICEGHKQPDEVRRQTIDKYREVFREALVKANMIDEALAGYLDEQPQHFEQAVILDPVEALPILKCPKCDSNMVIKSKRQDNGKYIGCVAFPTCKNVIWFPDAVEDIEILDETCTQCPDNILKKIKLKLTRNAFPVFGTSYTSCVGGCDEMFNNLLGIRPQTVRRARDLPDSGYESNATRSASNSRPTSANSNNMPSHPSSRSNSSNRSTNFNNNNSHNNNPTPTSTPRQQNWINDFSSLPRSGGNSSGNSRPNNSNGWTNTWNNQNTNTWNASGSAGGSNKNFNTNFNGTCEPESDEIMCNCHQVAKQLTVRKEGPNQGRIFYKCAKPQGESCDFFLWCPNSTGQASTSESGPNNRGFSNSASTSGRQGSNSNNWNQNFQNNRQNLSNNNAGQWNDNTSDWNDDNQVMCKCGNPARQLTVQKDGLNKGRQFYSCPSGVNSSCGFFQWADTVSGNSGNSGNSNNWNPPGPSGPSRGRGRGGGGATGAAPKKSRAPTAGGTKRKCGVCGIEGHTKRTCPNIMD
ncbi:DNA topoisomerase 3-alpha [Copidosoma floridanum]|uniref:DNA topoisomerase 3-alpha n=1 Tax=Copidosoma floridanum TaxID=29053 RepID=UPI0006C9C42A|nr:DNA topoisomerase 3-alpha [Copidosoma floridanum]